MMIGTEGYAGASGKLQARTGLWAFAHGTMTCFARHIHSLYCGAYGVQLEAALVQARGDVKKLNSDVAVEACKAQTHFDAIAQMQVAIQRLRQPLMHVYAAA